MTQELKVLRALCTNSLYSCCQKHQLQTYMKTLIHSCVKWKVHRTALSQLANQQAPSEME